MFHSRRSLSIRHLWKQRCTPPIRAAGEGVSPAPEELQSTLRPAAHQLFLKLKDEQLWLLAEALESRGRWDCGCLWVPWDGVRSGKLGPHLLLCKLYRWPDLLGPAELKRLPHCDNFWRKGPEGTRVCCNPYHYSRLSPSDLSVSHKSREPPQTPSQDSHRYPLRGIQDTSASRAWQGDGHWCKLAYWEHRSRVGRLFHVSEPSVHVFQHLPQGSGLCLGLLGGQRGSGAVRRARRKIGQGAVLSRELADVWLYNLSEHPIFLTSPTLPPAGARSQPAHRLPPGHCARVYDAEQALSLSRSAAPGEGPSDPHSVRISFAKGWGGGYSRQYISSCPCWLEILLCPPRHQGPGDTPTSQGTP